MNKMDSWNPEYELTISDSEDEEDLLTQSFKERNCILFVIDASLYNKPGLLENALLMLRSAFLSGLLVNDKDLMGLLFTNTIYSPTPDEPNCLEDIIMPNNCAVFLPPRQLNSDIVKRFLRFIEAAPNDFGEIYGIPASNVCCNFSLMLRLCLDLVQRCNYTVDNTTIVLITDNELPHPPQSEEYTQALQKAVDLRSKEVDFQLIPMVDVFNYDKFYKEFTCLIQGIDMECFEPYDPERLRDMLANRKLKQNFVKRSLGHFKFSLGPNLALSAEYFSFYQRHKRPRKVLLQRTDNVLVHKRLLTKIHMQNSETKLLEEARDVNIKHSWYEINFGTDCLRLSYEQVNRVRNIHSPGMVLLGFKPFCSLKNAKYSKPANFMYPDDMHIEGSKRLFRALWERCLIKKKVAICVFMCKRKSMPRYVALIPIQKSSGSHNKEFVHSNDGFMIKYLSCTSYIRDSDLSYWNSIENYAAEPGLTICEKVIKKFRLDFKSSILCDPNLDQLQSKLLCLAFNGNFETMCRQYFPNSEHQDQRIDSIISSFMQVFGMDVSPAQKRESNDTTNVKIGSKRTKRVPKAKS